MEIKNKLFTKDETIREKYSHREVLLDVHPRNGRFGGQNGFVRELIHGMGGSMDGMGLVGYLSENLPNSP